MAVATPIGMSSTPTSPAVLAASETTATAAAPSNNNKKVVTPAVETEWTTDLDRRYDLTPVDQRRRATDAAGSGFLQQQAAPPSYFIDPWEVSVQEADADSELAVLTVDVDPASGHKNNTSSATPSAST